MRVAARGGGRMPAMRVNPVHVWLWILLTAAAPACGTRRLAGSSPPGSWGPASGTPAPLQQVVAVSWVLEPLPDSGGVPQIRISLALTDETGATNIQSISQISGQCSKVAPVQKDAVIAVRCTHGDSGAQLEVRRFGAELVILRAPIFPDEAELSFEEYQRFPIPHGAAVRAGARE